ncbi:unnamed protein product, partial [Rotaria sp. Silwood1]
TPPPIKPRRVHQQQQKFNRPRFQQQHHQNYHHSPTPNLNINYNVPNYNKVKRTLNGIILSDSMCSRLRMYAIRKLPNYNVELSYESGCDIYGMINWLRTPEGQQQ